MCDRESIPDAPLRAGRQPGGNCSCTRAGVAGRLHFVRAAASSGAQRFRREEELTLRSLLHVRISLRDATAGVLEGLHESRRRSERRQPRVVPWVRLPDNALCHSFALASLALRASVGYRRPPLYVLSVEG